MPIDLKHMVKVYNYVNDEKRPKFNYKFLGLFVALSVATAALVAFAFTLDDGAAPGPGPQNPAASETRTDYVGLSPSEIAQSAGLPPGLLQERLDSWYAAHPRAEIEALRPVYEDGLVVGYLITFREPQ